MTVQEIMERFRKLPAGMEVRYAKRFFGDVYAYPVNFIRESEDAEQEGKKFVVLDSEST